MPTYYAQASANWDAVSGGTTSSVWNTAADGSGTWLDLTGLVSGASFTSLGDTFDLNSKTVNLNVGGSVSPSISVAKIQTSTAGKMAIGNSGSPILTVSTATTGIYSIYAGSIVSWGTGTCTLTVNGDIQYAASSTTGCFTYTTNQTVIVNGKCSNTGSGRLLNGSGSGVFTATNTGLTVVESTGSGTCVTHTATGALTVTGDSYVTRGVGLRIAGACVANIIGTLAGVSDLASYLVLQNAAATTTVTGDVSVSGLSSVGLYASNGTMFFIGNAVGHNAISVAGGNIVWLGSRTIAAGENTYVPVTSGVLYLSLNIGMLTLTCSGQFVVNRSGGDVVVEYDAAHPAEFIRYVDAAQIAIVDNRGTDYSAYIKGPTLPNEADVVSGVTYGYAGDPQTGTLVAGGGGGEHSYVFVE